MFGVVRGEWRRRRQCAGSVGRVLELELELELDGKGEVWMEEEQE